MSGQKERKVEMGEGTEEGGEKGGREKEGKRRGGERRGSCYFLTRQPDTS